MWDSVVGHWDSMDCKIVVFQSPATPDGIRVPTACYAKNAKKPTDETPRWAGGGISSVSLCTNLELKLSLRRRLAHQTRARRMYNP
jgi:hypothetical protein